MLKVNNKDTRTRRRCGCFIVNFETYLTSLLKVCFVNFEQTNIWYVVSGLTPPQGFLNAKVEDANRLLKKNNSERITPFVGH